MANSLQLLTQIAESLRIVGAPAAVEPGIPLTLGLSPPISLATLTDIVDKAIDLDFVSALQNANLSGNLPVGLPTGIISEPIDLDMAGNIVGKLTGMLPIPNPSQFTPKLEVEWTISDERGAILNHEQHYLAPDGLETLFLNLILLPEFVSVGLTVPPPVKRVISAKVKLTKESLSDVEDIDDIDTNEMMALALRVGSDRTEVTIDLPPVTILVPQIPVPRVLAMAMHTNFMGPVAVILPANAFLGSILTTLNLLKRIQTVLSLVSTVKRLAAMLAGVNALIAMLECPKIGVGICSSDNTYRHLNDLDVDYGPWYTGRHNDIEAEDEMSSFVYIGPSGSKVTLYVDQDVELDGGWPWDDGGGFTITSGLSLVTLCASLHSSRPRIFPNIDDDPTFGSRLTIEAGSSTFGDQISSIRFS